MKRSRDRADMVRSSRQPQATALYLSEPIQRDTGIHRRGWNYYGGI